MCEFSVIIPVYNVNKYLRKCLDSVINQTFEDFEVILIDDGSTDDSGAICDEYSNIHKKVRAFHQENKGVCAARNLGINLATGNYIVFIDSDDFVKTDYLTVIKENSNGSDLVFWGDVFLFQDGSRHIHQPVDCYCNSRREVENVLFQLKRNKAGFEYFGYMMNKAFRNSIIKQHSLRFVEGLNFREDEIFTSNYCKYVKSLRVIPTSLYYYRILDSGLCSQPKSAGMILKYCEVLKETITFWQSPELKDWEQYRYVSFLFQAYGYSSEWKKKWSVAHKIRKEYTRKSNKYLKPSFFFRMPLFLFRLCLVVKLCINKKS